MQKLNYWCTLLDYYFFHTNLLFMAFLKDGSPTTKSFDHLRSEVDAEEAEEVGVEHLLR